MSKPFSHLFLSYSSADENIACELKVYLEKRIRDLEVFMATQSIQRGEDWERRVHSSLKESFAFVPIITKDWQESRWCFGEWVAACVLGEIIFPFVETTVELRSELGRIQHIRFRKEQPEFEKLAEDIDRIFSQHTAKRDFNKSPFPYAFRYESDDAHLFRGRDKEIDTIVSQLNAMRHSYTNRALILHGSSGAGKSSLVRAGLYPKLARTSNFWIVTELFKTEDKPVDVLLDRLYQSLTSADVTAKTSADVTAKYAARAIKGIRSATEEKLAGALEGVTALLDGKSLVLIVDNLDRYCNHDTPQSKRLLVLLRAAIRTRSIKVIGVLRTDQLPRVAKALDISVSEYESICIIRPDPETLISSMNEVLSEKGYVFDRDLIHTIYVDAGASMEAWRLIGRCLNDLWTTAEDKPTAFQLTNYRQKGGIRGQIQNDLATVETGLDTEIENFFDFLAVEGVSHLEGQTVVSRPIPVARIHSDHKHAIDLLVEKGLIVAGNKDATGEAVIEIVPAVIEKYWSGARIVSRVNALEELLEARRAADQWKLKGNQIEWLVHRGKRLSHVKNLIERRRLAYSEMSVYLEECERHFHS